MRQQDSEGLFLLSNLPLLPFNILAFLGSYGALLGGKAGQIIAVVVGTGVSAMTLVTAKHYLKTRQHTDLILLMIKQHSYFRQGLEAEVYDCVQSFDEYEINWLKIGKKPILYTTYTTISQTRIRFGE
jgi:hypothetical protein